MVFATTTGPHAERALPNYNLSDIFTLNNVYRLQALKFTHMWHKGILSRLFDNLFQYAVAGTHTKQDQLNLYPFHRESSSPSE